MNSPFLFQSAQQRQQFRDQTDHMHAVSYLLRRLHSISLSHPKLLTHSERGLLLAAREGRAGETYRALKAEGKIR